MGVDGGNLGHRWDGDERKGLMCLGMNVFAQRGERNLQVTCTGGNWVVAHTSDI